MSAADYCFLPGLPYGARVNLLGLSSGKDSTAALAWALNESGYDPRTVVTTFCDTENEYPEVYDQIHTLSDYCQLRGAPPTRILRSEGFLALAMRKHRFPSAKARFCTEVLKMLPTLYFVQELQLAGYAVVSHSGVRAAESTERSTLPEEDWNGFLNCPVRRPLLRATLAQVWGYHKRYGLPINPLYFNGRRRVGCRLCCMSNKQDVRITARTRPEVIAMYADWELLVGKEFSMPNGSTQPRFSGFFRATQVPAHFRSKQWYNKDGKPFKVCTMNDVVKWSKTLRGGKQLALDFLFDMEDEPIFEIDDALAPCKSGYCE